MLAPPLSRGSFILINQVFIPGLVGTGESFKSLNWAYKTSPQEHLGDRQVVIGAGKVLGGGTISVFNQIS
jgi:hypothetical protein